MKALPMLDQVMLSIARAFTAMMAYILGLFLLLYVIGLIFFGLHYLNSREWLGHAPVARDLLFSAYAFLLFASVRLLPGMVARVCLGLNALVVVPLLAYAVCGYLAAIFSLHDRDAFAQFFLPFLIIVMVFLLLAFFSFGWIAIRPPKEPKASKFSDVSSFSRPLFQS